METHRKSAVAGAAVCLVLGLGGVGCLETDSRFGLARSLRPPGPLQSPAPSATSPTAALRLLEWSYNNRSLTHLGELYSGDFRLFCSATDSAGAQWRGTPWTREDELISASHLFLGGNADQPAARRIALAFDRNLFVYPDPSFTASDPAGRWHKSIRTIADLRIVFEDGGVFEIVGHVSFYLVRGDSAVIPEDLRRRGVGPDSSRWYLRRWDDDTGGGASGAPRPSAIAATRRAPLLDAQPSRGTSWCGLKAQYR